MLVILPGLRKPSKELHVLYYQSVAHPGRAAMGGYKRVMLPNRVFNPYLGDFAYSGATDFRLFVDSKGDRRFSERSEPASLAPIGTATLFIFIFRLISGTPCT
jgi:hypothetical protein